MYFLYNIRFGEMKMEKLKFAILGCGRIFNNHSDALKNWSDRAELVAVCDTDEDLAKVQAKKNNCNFYKNYDEMLLKEKIDILSVCTPSGMHPEHGIKAANMGINVLTEKPIGVNVQSADNLISACEKNKVKLFVVKQNRLNPTINILKRTIEKGRFGKIFMVNVNVFWKREQEYYDSAKWRGTWELDGGAFLNQAVHYADLIQWLIGPVDSVMAHTETLKRNIEAEDTGSVSLKFKNGAMGALNVTMLVYNQNLEGSITIIGEKGTVKLGGVAVNNVLHWEFESEDEDDILIKESTYTPKNIYGFGHVGFYNNVINSVLGIEKPISDGKEGRKSLEIVQAIYKSSREGIRVNLPLKFENYIA
jgi:UDP-N-acetyl-2-amino-2-deoxyglucuronate dehydrogenase